MVVRLTLALLLGSSLALPAPTSAQDRPSTRPAPGQSGGGPGGGRPGSGNGRPGGSNGRPGGGSRPNPGGGPGTPGNRPGGPGGGPPGGGSRPNPGRPNPGNPGRPIPGRPNPGRPIPGRPNPGHRPGGRPPGWGRPPQNRPPYHFRPSDRDFLRRHYLRHLAYINLARRPIFTVGGYIPYGDIGYLTPVPVELYGSLPPIPPGYQVGYFDGYVAVYDPITYFIADLIDLVAR